MWAPDPLCTFGEEESAWTRVKVWPPDSSARILVTILTELSGLTTKYYSRELAATCFLCSSPDLNLLVSNFVFCIHVNNHCHRVTTQLQLIIIIIIIIIIIYYIYNLLLLLLLLLLYDMDVSVTGISSRYFSWTSSDPHRSRFKLHTAVLSVLCVLFRV